VAGLHVGGGENPTVQRANAENREEIFGDFGGFEALRFGAAFGGEFLGSVSVDGHGQERSSRVAHVGDIRERDAETGEIEEGAAGVEVHEFVRMREWERAEENGVDNGEDGGVGANAESEGHDGDGGKGRRFSEKTEGEAGVVEEAFYEWKGLLFTHELFGLCEAAEFKDCDAVGFVGRHAGAEAVVDVEFEVRLKFGVEVSVEPMFAKQVAETGEESVHGWLSREYVGTEERFRELRLESGWQSTSGEESEESEHSGLWFRQTEKRFLATLGTAAVFAPGGLADLRIAAG